jgi:hypothetical protein
MDIWVATDPNNSGKVAGVVREFGFLQATPELFQQPGNIVRMGLPPIRIEVLTSISGVEFADCYQRRAVTEIDGETVSVISLEDLRRNKAESGRLKDLMDLEELR